MSLVALFALGGSLLVLRYSRDKALDSAPQAVSVTPPSTGFAPSPPSEPDASDKAEAELPLADQPAIAADNGFKAGQQESVDLPEHEDAHAERSAFSKAVDKVILNPELLHDFEVDRHLGIALEESLEAKIVLSKSEDERVGYINGVILSFDLLIRTLDQGIIRLEAVKLKELERAEMERKFKLEVDIREKYSTGKALAENAVLEVPFAFGSGTRVNPGAIPEARIGDLRRDRIRFLFVGRA